MNPSGIRAVAKYLCRAQPRDKSGTQNAGMLPRPYGDGRSVRRHQARRSASRGVMGEDIVVIFRRDVTGEAGLVERLVARLFPCEVSEAPATGRGVLL